MQSEVKVSSFQKNCVNRVPKTRLSALPTLNANTSDSDLSDRGWPATMNSIATGKCCYRLDAVSLTEEETVVEDISRSPKTNGRRQ